MRVLRAHVSSRAKNPADGWCRQAASGLLIPGAALAAMAFSSASPTFQCTPSPGTQLRPLDSGFCHRSFRHATNPARDSDVGARETFWFVKLAGRPVFDRIRRDVFADGLCVLVVALGQSHDSALLAFS